MKGVTVKELTVKERLLGAVRGVRWYVTSLMGDRAYATWVAHLALEHPEQTPVSEREFWRARYREQETTPGARCC